MPDSQPSVYGIFGYPVEHSASPAMHNAAFEKLEINAQYKKFPVAPPDLEKEVRNIIQSKIMGLNITIPHKQAVMPFLDTLANSAIEKGAVNTIEISNGKLIGHNTDGAGFKMALSNEANFNFTGKSVFLAGAGGAGWAVATECISNNVKRICVMDSDYGRAVKLLNHIKKIAPDNPAEISILLFNDTEKIKDVLSISDLAVNATPIGMKEDGQLPFPVDCLPKNAVVYDLVYNIPSNALIRAAKNCGLTACNGLGMLLYQGVEAFKIWTKIQNPPIGVMREALEKHVYGERV